MSDRESERRFFVIVIFLREIISSLNQLVNQLIDMATIIEMARIIVIVKINHNHKKCQLIKCCNYCECHNNCENCKRRYNFNGGNYHVGHNICWQP